MSRGPLPLRGTVYASVHTHMSPNASSRTALHLRNEVRDEESVRFETGDYHDDEDVESLIAVAAQHKPKLGGVGGSREKRQPDHDGPRTNKRII